MAFAPVFQRPFSATFDRRAAVAAAPNGLLNSLIAYWPGNEASGNLQDAHTNALHLTDTNTVTNAAGKVYATARQYTVANSEYHTLALPPAALQFGDVDCTFAAWVYLDSVGADRYFASVDGAIGLMYQHSSARFAWWISTPFVLIAASTFGAVSLSAWHLLIGWHDSVANTISVSVNNGTADSTATGASSPRAGQWRVSVGAYAAGTAPQNGRIGPVAIWKSAAGGGGVLTAAQRSSFYNAGNGLAYSAFTA